MLLGSGSHHPNALTVGANPGGAIADPPLVLFKAFLANLKTAGATPAEFLFLTAAVTLIFTKLSPAIPFLFFPFSHFPSSFNIQLRYGALILGTGEAIISGTS